MADGLHNEPLHHVGWLSLLDWLAKEKEDGVRLAAAEALKRITGTSFRECARGRGSPTGMSSNRCAR